jgi:hypothetical protein
MSDRIKYNREKIKVWKKNHPDRVKEQKRLYRERHREQIKDKNRKYRLKLQIITLKHYGGDPPKCICCGETILKFLTIDHINGGGTTHRKQIFRDKRGGWEFYRWLINNSFPEGFQILCFNCNCGRARNDGICPHKSP